MAAGATSLSRWTNGVKMDEIRGSRMWILARWREWRRRGGRTTWAAELPVLIKINRGEPFPIKKNNIMHRYYSSAKKATIFFGSHLSPLDRCDPTLLQYIIEKIIVHGKIIVNVFSLFMFLVHVLLQEVHRCSSWEVLASARTAVSNPYPRQQGQQEVLGHESQELIEYDYQMQDFYGVLEVG